MGLKMSFCLFWGFLLVFMGFSRIKADFFSVV